MFVYQGNRIPLPKDPISAPLQRQIEETHIISCQNEHPCLICEKCLIKYIVRDEVIKNGKEVEIVLPESNMEIVNNFNTFLDNFNLSDEIIFCSENSVNSLLETSLDYVLKGSSNIGKREVEKNTETQKEKDEVIKKPVEEKATNQTNQTNQANKSDTPIDKAIPNKEREENPPDIPETSEPVNQKEMKTPTKSNKGKQNVKSPINTTNKVTKPAAKPTKAKEIENIACYGKIGTVSWGCRRTFKAMKDLKKHWEDPNGSACLREFITLRHSTKNA